VLPARPARHHLGLEADEGPSQHNTTHHYIIAQVGDSVSDNKWQPKCSGSEMSEADIKETPFFKRMKEVSGCSDDDVLPYARDGINALWRQMHPEVAKTKMRYEPLRYTVWITLDDDPTKAIEQMAKIDAHLNTLDVEYSSQASTDE